jgi:hypothetical protein
MPSADRRAVTGLEFGPLTPSPCLLKWISEARARLPRLKQPSSSQCLVFSRRRTDKFGGPKNGESRICCRFDLDSTPTPTPTVVDHKFGRKSESEPQAGICPTWHDSRGRSGIEIHCKRPIVWAS